MPDFTNLPVRDGSGAVHVVVESPRGSMMKLKFEPSLGAFVFSRALPLGTVSPYDWGFIPSTRAADGDPLDGLLLFDAPTWPGVVIPARPIGVVRLMQKDQDTKKSRNDRIIAVADSDHRNDDARALPKRVREELELFFLNVIQFTRKRVTIEGWEGPKFAERLVDQAVQAYVRGAG